MIKIGNDFEIERDGNCWNLHRIITGVSRRKETKGQPTTYRQTRYYNSLETICEKIIDIRAGYAEQLDEVVEKIDEAKREIKVALANWEKRDE